MSKTFINLSSDVINRSISECESISITRVNPKGWEVYERGENIPVGICNPFAKVGRSCYVLCLNEEDDCTFPAKYFR